MENYRLLYDSKPEFIADRHGETFDGKAMPLDLEEWYSSIPNSDYGYVAKINGTVGFLYTTEESHMGQPTDTEGYNYSRKHGSRTEESVFELLTEIAATLKEKVHPYDIYIGQKTGFSECHEFCVFFPISSNVKDINKIIELFDATYLTMVEEKWKSFYDLLDIH